ncbi:MAG: SUMF1/EgtB/PvdO family nonheme iron enzyme [Nannocystaceae bacterium]
MIIDPRAGGGGVYRRTTGISATAIAVVLAAAPVTGVAILIATAMTACAHRNLLDTQGARRVEGGSFLMGSTLDERARALELSYAGYGRITPEAAHWIKREFRQGRVDVPAYWIMEKPVTQADYFRFILDTGAPEPYVDRDTWARASVGYDYARVERALWPSGGPAQERLHHPVVLVSQPEALKYCLWWGAARGGRGWLPSEAQWEKAARGTDGRRYPWGDPYNPGLLNSADAGPGDTVPVGAFPEAPSPYGVQDMAGNVFEWTSTREGAAQYVVKGGAWNSHGSMSRAAARHARPEALRHLAIGFRCVLNPTRKKRSKAGRHSPT